MKTIYRGQKELQDPETGKRLTVDIISKTGDTLDKKGWRRVVMTDLMQAIDEIGNKKIKVLEYLIDNMDSNNQINKTYRQIQEETNISLQTITETFKALKECNLIKKHGGVYVLNCSIISAYGSAEKNAYLVIEYAFDDSKSILTNKSKSNKLAEELEEANKEIERLKKLLEKQNLLLETA